MQELFSDTSTWNSDRGAGQPELTSDRSDGQLELSSDRSDGQPELSSDISAKEPELKKYCIPVYVQIPDKQMLVNHHRSAGPLAK